MTERWMILHGVPKLQEWCHRQKDEWFCRCLTVSQVVRMMRWHTVEWICKCLFPILGEWCHDRKLNEWSLQVFPELREWCHDRKLKLVECDLRWGVPKDATSSQALATCLEEIDRCYEANGQPFFLNLLGERWSCLFSSVSEWHSVMLWCDWVLSPFLFYFIIIGLHLNLYNKFFLVLSVVHIWLIVCYVCAN